MLKALAREPLVHFLLLGAALFLVDALLRPAATPAASTQIAVSETRIHNLAQSFRRTWQRPPTQEELDGLVESHVREEIYYREALALGLDRDDAIIRRRLQQKMEFLSEETASLAMPSDEDLSTYLAANAAKFRVEPRVTFAQVYLDPRKRGAALAGDAARLLDALNAVGTRIDPASQGDGMLMLEARYADAAPSDLARLFGREFAEALFKQPVGTWSGPIRSGYGAHVVLVESVAPGGAPSLDDVRPLVEREWAEAKRKEVANAFYEKLRVRYKVTVKSPEAATP